MSPQDGPSVSAFPAECSSNGLQNIEAGAPAVLIASPETDLRNQIRERLQGVYPTHEISQREFLDETISTLNPAVVLLDAELLRSTRFTDFSIVRRASRKVRFIVLSASPNDAEGIASLKAGARGYCERGIDGSLLRKAVEGVRRGETWADRRLILLLVEQCTRQSEERTEIPIRPDSRLAVLTPRQREIAWMVAGGSSNRDIAAQLEVGEGTVKAHLTAIYRALGFSDRLKLGLYLAKNNARNRRQTLVTGPWSRVSPRRRRKSEHSVGGLETSPPPALPPAPEAMSPGQDSNGYV